MSFKTKATSGGDFSDAPPAGNHPAVLVGLIDLGTQETEFQGVVDWKPKVYLIWELVTEKQSGTKDVNHVIARDFTFSFTPKSMLRGFIEKWRNKPFTEGEEFDLEKLLGKACLLTVIQKTSAKGNTFAKVEGVAAVPKGMNIDKPQRTPFKWNMGDGGVFPDWIPYLYGSKISEVIDKSEEMVNTKNGVSAPAGEPVGAGAFSADEAPF